jgi:hypothetical protein
MLLGRVGLFEPGVFPKELLDPALVAYLQDVEGCVLSSIVDSLQPVSRQLGALPQLQNDFRQC